MNVPTEHEEQKALVMYLNLMGLKHTSIPNATFTKSWKQKAKNKAEGLCPGLPDLLIIVNNHLVFIEMKRVKGGVVSQHQKDWIEALNKCNNVQAYVAKGSDEAIEIIERLQSKIK